MYDIIAVGSATIDVFAHTENELIKIKTREGEQELIAYRAGTKILVERLRFETGGGGTNVSVSFVRMGLRTAFLGKLGNDANGDAILEQLKSEGVDFIGKRSRSQTGYSIILDSIEDDRTILTFKGANDELNVKELDMGSTLARWFYFSSMVDRSFKEMLKIMAHAKRIRAKIAFNPSSYLTKKGLPYLRKAISMSDVLVLNREEAEMLIGKHEFSSLPKLLARYGPRIVAVTDGREGVHAWDSHGHFLAANKVKVAETTGAGDAFASGMVAALARGKDLRYALNIGMANATSVVKYMGAKNRLLTWKDATRLMRRNMRLRTYA